MIERNRIHNCGQLPATNHHHGIYVEASDRARITDNWIYDNADRGVQLFPDAQETYIARNVIDGNGQGIIFSRESAHNLAENNVISNPVLRYNIEDWELTGAGNVARRNCVWSTRHQDNAGIQPGLGVATVENKVIEPRFLDRGGKDFRLRGDSPCLDLAPSLQPAARKAPQAGPGREPSQRHGRRLAGRPPAPERQGRVQERTRIGLEAGDPEGEARGRWRRVGTMRLRAGRYLYRPQLGRRRGAVRRFGGLRVKRGARVLRLRAHVKGAGRSNVVRIRVGR